MKRKTVKFVSRLHEKPSFLTIAPWQMVGKTILSFPNDYLRPFFKTKLGRVTSFTALAILITYSISLISASVIIYRNQSSNRFTHSVEKISPFLPAAYAGKETIPLNRFRTEVQARQFYAEANSLDSNQAETESFVLTQLINRSIIAQELKKNNQVVTSSALEEKLQEVYTLIGGKDKLQDYLNANYGPSVSTRLFETWIKESLQEELFKHTVLERVKVSHILIAAPEGNTEAQVEAARQKAVTVKEKLADLSQFSAIASEFSDDIASRDNGGVFGETNRGDSEPVLSREFEEAIFSLPVNSLSEPIRTSYGWHLVLITEKTGSIPLSKQVFIENKTNELKVKRLVAK